MAKVRPEYYVAMKGGKQHPTYPGVLIAAHEAGLISLETEVLQYPAEENGWSAVVRATAIADPGDGRQRVFSDIGDCSPKNTTPLIALASLRMASTRAKGRALRDLIALGETLLEELPEEEPAGNGHSRPPSPVPAMDQAIKAGPACIECGTVLTGNVYKAAMQQFHRPLCIPCGKAYRDTLRAQAEAETAPAE